MDKKGAEMPLNVIIIAILVLLVLVIVSVIFVFKIGTFNVKVTDCAQQANHVCTTDSACQTDPDGNAIVGYTPDTQFTCKKTADEQAQYCCLKIG
jgi:flagellar basal body-associated protein FliL